MRVKLKMSIFAGFLKKDMNKNMIKLAALLLATFSILSCTKDIEQKDENISGRHLVTLTAASGDASAEQGGASTKVMFPSKPQNPATIYWQKGDRIAVQATGSETLYPLTLQSRSSNLQSAVFSGEIEGELGGYAVYPYNEGHKISGTTLTYHLPSEYTCSGIDTDWVANSDKIDDSKLNANLALLAKITKGEDGAESAVFNHLCGLLCIKIDKMPSSVCTLTLTADKKICGDFTVNLTDSQPEIESDEASSTDNVVTVNTSGGIYNNSCVYYIPMPVGEYSVTVELSYGLIKGKENGSGTAAKTVEIERASIKRVSITQSTMYKGGYKIIEGHRFIDLGLSSGILWAETNIGADMDADCGGYYEWGGLETKSSYDWSSTTASFPDGFFSGSDVLKLPDANDAAKNLWHTSCRMPTNDEVHELKNNTDQSCTSRKDSNGSNVAGMEFKSKTNGNSIFFPFNGYKYNSSSSGGGYGYYWTSNLTPKLKEEGIIWDDYSYDVANIFCFTNGWISPISDESRVNGCGIRPVVKP